MNMPWRVRVCLRGTNREDKRYAHISGKDARRHEWLSDCLERARLLE